MGTENILDELIDDKLIAVLRFFIDNPEKQFYLREVAKKVKVSPASTMRIIRKLVKLEVLKEIHIKAFKLYQIEDNDIIKFLDSIISTKKNALEEFINMIKDLAGLSQVVLHGKETADKASVIIVGIDVDAEKIRQATFEVQDKYKYNIMYLTIEPAQFEQMTAMGLYPGKKVTLYQK
ncbi:MAG: hypothetical protein KKG59_02065 [Nanoarchaeota archaeon]|nr:hypothetical protein [Nanoarchaeota archaeon]